MRIGLVLLAAIAITLSALYLARRLVAREVLVGWLDARGARADVDFQRIDLDGLVASVRVGEAGDPDFAAERVEVDYALRGFWSSRGPGVDVRSVRLVRPVLRARWRDGVLSFGSLDRVVEELRRRPPEPDATKPLILVEGARGRIDTAYGTLAVQADARVEDARLITLDAKLGPTALRGEDVRVEVAGGALALATQGDRVNVDLRVAATAIAVGGDEAKGLRLRLAGQAPYPDLERRRGDGAVDMTLETQFDEARLGQVSIGGLAAKAQFEGQATGWVDTLALAGPVQASLKAARVDAGEAKVAALDLGFAGQARWTKADWRAQGTTSGTLRGGWRGLGPPTRQDAPELAA